MGSDDTRFPLSLRSFHEAEEGWWWMMITILILGGERSLIFHWISIEKQQR
jgi:hypothetical protein